MSNPGKIVADTRLTQRGFVNVPVREPAFGGAKWTGLASCGCVVFVRRQRTPLRPITKKGRLSAVEYLTTDTVTVTPLDSSGVGFQSFGLQPRPARISRWWKQWYGDRVGRHHRPTVARVRQTRYAVYAIAFSPDGKTLASLRRLGGTFENRGRRADLIKAPPHQPAREEITSRGRRRTSRGRFDGDFAITKGFVSPSRSASSRCRTHPPACRPVCPGPRRGCRQRRPSTPGEVSSA